MSESEKKLIAPCGLYCGNCNDYIAHIKNDDDLKKKVATAINKQLNINISSEQVGCEGCWGTLHTEYSSNLDCEVRCCAEQRNILSCALCENFPCEKLQNHFKGDNKKKINLDRIREIGLDTWLCEIKNNK
ncbi:MAG: DUF3795 domain-containing protein [Planctomycetota bacterium]